MPTRKEARTVLRKALPLFLLVAAVTAAALGSVATAFYVMARDERMQELIDEEVYSVQRAATAMQTEFDNVVSDVLFLAGQNEMVRFLDTGEASHLAGMQSEFLHMASVKKTYDQIRFLDDRGMEKVRVNLRDGRARPVPEDRLQDKRGRYYFSSTAALGKGDVFVSPLDLNVENGVIEQPPKPLIRIATPLFDSTGNQKGVVMVNFDATRMLDRVAESESNARGHLAMLNHSGYWLLGPEKRLEWGFMFPDRKEHTFGNRFPDEWNRIREMQSGHFESGNGLFAFTTIHPLQENYQSVCLMRPEGGPKPIGAQAYFWVLLSHIPKEVLADQSKDIAFRIFAGCGALLLFMLGGGAHLSIAITRRRLYQAKLVKWALYDGLTGLANRKLFFDRMAAALSMAKRHERRFGLLYIDLDGFKAINDTYGHEAGDDLLVQVAVRLTRVIRQSDTAARLGGDEFAVILTEIKDTGAAFGVGEKIVAELSRPIDLKEASVTVGASIGVAVYPDHGDSEERLVQGADKAMYASKAKGKNCCTAADLAED